VSITKRQTWHDLSYQQPSIHPSQGIGLEGLSLFTVSETSQSPSSVAFALPFPLELPGLLELSRIVEEVGVLGEDNRLTNFLILSLGEVGGVGFVVSEVQL
jgi:hypothetical protein